MVGFEALRSVLGAFETLAQGPDPSACQAGVARGDQVGFIPPLYLSYYRDTLHLPSVGELWPSWACDL